MLCTYAPIRLWLQELADARPALLGEQEIKCFFEERLHSSVVLDRKEFELLGHLWIEVPGDEALVLAGGTMESGNRGGDLGGRLVSRQSLYGPSSRMVAAALPGGLRLGRSGSGRFLRCPIEYRLQRIFHGLPPYDYACISAYTYA